MIVLGLICGIVYLGAYDEENAAAQAYDLAALKYWGPGTLINFKVKNSISAFLCKDNNSCHSKYNMDTTLECIVA